LGSRIPNHATLTFPNVGQVDLVGAVASATLDHTPGNAERLFAVKFINFVEYRDLDKIASARPAHFAYADRLRTQGKRAIGGPLMDDQGGRIALLFVYEAVSRDEVLAFAQEDPFTLANASAQVFRNKRISEVARLGGWAVPGFPKNISAVPSIDRERKSAPRL
jgi:uncharacterized protein YciI